MSDLDLSLAQQSSQMNFGSEGSANLGSLGSERKGRFLVTNVSQAGLQVISSLS